MIRFIFQFHYDIKHKRKYHVLNKIAVKILEKGLTIIGLFALTLLLK